MDDALRERLVCPACRGELRWDISSRHAHRIDDGEARCSSCDSGYPVRDGIGLFLTPDLQRNDLWESAESGLSRYLRQHPEVETQILDSPLTALNPADLFFRGYVLEERGRWGEAEEAFAAARPGLYTPEANACSDALALMERKRHMGRPTIVDLREIVNALLYLTRTGCQWRLLPTDFPNWNTVRYYFDQWTLDRTFIRINDALRERARRKAGRDPEPSAGIIDSQSVKTTEAGGERGFDGGKKVTGRKRHILVDTQGNLVVVIVHPANIPDRNGADWVLEAAREKSTRLRHVWIDNSASKEY